MLAWNTVASVWDLSELVWNLTEPTWDSVSEPRPDRAVSSEMLLVTSGVHLPRASLKALHAKKP